jgi:hypothetical protein
VTARHSASWSIGIKCAGAPVLECGIEVQKVTNLHDDDLARAMDGWLYTNDIPHAQSKLEKASTIFIEYDYLYATVRFFSLRLLLRDRFPSRLSRIRRCFFTSCSESSYSVPDTLPIPRSYPYRTVQDRQGRVPQNVLGLALGTDARGDYVTFRDDVWGGDVCAATARV